MLHSLLIGGQWNAGTALGVGYQQSPCFSDSVAPGCDIAAFQTAVGLVGRVFSLLCQLTLAAHTLLAVFPCMVQVAQVDAYTQDTANGKAGCCTQPLLEGLLTDGINKVSQTHKAHHKKEVIAHLNMVAQNLQSCEDTC